MDHKNEDSNALRVLVGKELSAVVFVRDYIQLQFDGPGLTVINDPVMVVGGNRHQPRTPGYRDAICDRIGHPVTDAFVKEGEGIRIDFDDGSRIEVSLRADDAIGPESAIFDQGEDTWVW